jgi:hypothetical protein
VQVVERVVERVNALCFLKSLHKTLGGKCHVTDRDQQPYPNK